MPRITPSGATRRSIVTDGKLVQLLAEMLVRDPDARILDMQAELHDMGIAATHGRISRMKEAALLEALHIAQRELRKERTDG